MSSYAPPNLKVMNKEQFKEYMKTLQDEKENIKPNTMKRILHDVSSNLMEGEQTKEAEEIVDVFFEEVKKLVKKE